MSKEMGGESALGRKMGSMFVFSPTMYQVVKRI